MRELTERQRTILFQIVRAFVHDGEPVSSASVARSKAIDVSSATVRSVMSDLESLGLLHQPHTSAGRVPTSGGLRLFVDALQEHETGSADSVFESELRAKLIGLEEDDSEGAARTIGGLLSDLAKLTSIVAAPGLGGARLRDIHLTSLSERRILVVLVTSDEQIFHRVVQMHQDIGPTELQRIENYLSGLTIGLTLEQVRVRVRLETESLEREWNEMVRLGLDIGRQALEVAQPAVFVEGKLNVFDYAELTSNVEGLKHLLEVLEERELVLELLDGVLSTRAPRVLIGRELDIDLGADISLVVCGYGEGPEPVGVVGVIGPSRIDYERIIPMVHLTARTLTELLLKK